MANCETLFYRNRLAVPKARKIKTQETLIDDLVVEDFLKHVSQRGDNRGQLPEVLRAC
jgi:hypothetical protein